METNASSDGAVRSPNSGGPQSATSSKRNKPCQQCQKLKVKCERTSAGGPCQRCQAQSKECTYHEPPSKRAKKNPDEYDYPRGLSDVGESMNWRRHWRQ